MQQPEVDENGALLHSPDQREREVASARLGRFQWAFARAALFTVVLTWWTWGGQDRSGPRRIAAFALTLVVVTGLNWLIDPWLQRRRSNTPS